MKKVAGVAALAVAVLLYTQSPVIAWTPPIGIPAPPFGINEVAGPVTHYVDNTSPSATDTNNPNGSVTKPRLTIPSVLAAGSVVEVQGGPYIYNVSGPPAVTASGTASRPVFVRGVNLPSIQGAGTAAQGYSDRMFLMAGSYYIVEGFKFSNGTTMNVGLSGDHGVLRNSEVANFQPPGYSAAVTGGGSYHVIYKNRIHHSGNYRSTVDNKVHGIKFSAGISYLWILNNEIDHNGGQAIQLGDDNIADDSTWPHHIYLGYNFMHEDREAALGIKQARDVIVSQNDAGPYYELPPGSDPSTSAIPSVFGIAHFGTHRVWALFNKVHNGVIGIRANANRPEPPHPPESDVYLIGNLIYEIHSAGYKAGDPYSTGAAVLGWQNLRVYVVDNTIVNCDKGISFTSTGYYEVTGNVVKNTRDPMSLIPANWGTNRYDYNFYDPAARVAWNNPTPIISLSEMQRSGQELHSRQGATLLDTNYKPVTGAPIVNASVRSGVYDTFFALYGIDIAKDIAGTPRPQGSAWSMGAYELPSGAAAAPSGGAPQPPTAPSGLVVR